MAERKLTIVCGLPGSGKTAVARLLSEAWGADLLRSDVLRKDMLTLPTYDDDEKQTIYAALFERAGNALLAGRDVVLDAAFNKRANRERAALLADMTKADFILALVTSSEETIRDRLRRRNGDESDADWRVYQFLKARFERIEAPHVVITNDGDLASLEQQVKERLL